MSTETDLPTVKTITTFRIIRAEEPVRLEDPKTGQVTDYIVREMTGTDRDAYFQAMSNRQKTTPDGKTVVGVFGGIQAELISRCLFVPGPGGTSANVQVATIQSWPASVVEGLHELCERINGMDKDRAKAEEAVKNA